MDLREEAEALAPTAWLAHPDHHIASSVWDVAMVRYFGFDHPSAPHDAPVLSALVRPDDRVLTAGYLRLAAGTSLERHRGRRIGVARFHLALRVPVGCGMQVGDSVQGWHEGSWLAFDDSQFRSAWNSGDSDRVVVMLDAEHPMIRVPPGAGLLRFVSGRYYDAVRRWPRVAAGLAPRRGLS